MNLVFTLCSNNYLAQAICLGTSFLKYNHDYAFKIGLVDRKDEVINYNQIPFEQIEVEKIGIASFDEMIRQYSITELNTAVKPFYFKYFFDLNQAIDKIIYLDPDILVYGPFTELEKVLAEDAIVITPHFTTPINDDKFQAENDFLNSGLYNLGFLAVKRSIESAGFLDWWADRLSHKAYINFAKGMFTDQLWINFVPLFFKNVKVLTHPGYNTAYWNLHERSLTEKNNNYFVNSTFPLIFFHFSGYDPLKPYILSKYQNRFTFENRKDVLPLFSGYSELLFQNSWQYYKNFNCAFVEIKERLYEQMMVTKIKKVSIFKRLARKLILKFIRRFGIVLDYNTLTVTGKD